MFSGSFGDIDDVLLNSLGGLVGAGLAVVAGGVEVRAERPRRNPPLASKSRRDRVRVSSIAVNHATARDPGGHAAE